MSLLTLRSGTPTDQPALLELTRRASLANPADREVLLGHPEMVELPVEHLTDATSVVALLDGAFAGLGIVLPRADGDAELDGLFVEPQLWRRGVGKSLVSECVRLAIAFGARRMHVTANPAAEGFYLRAGFTGADRIALTFGIGILMSRKLR